jgi:DNA invertase Pin-like site-specific DNA recombinase
MTRTSHAAPFVALDDLDPSTVRVAILARSSNPGSKPEDMTEQVKQCQEFIDAMHWPQPPEAFIFTEAKSGIRQVARPILEEVLSLAQRRVIDVVVCRELERVDRIKTRRYMVIEQLLQFGVELRFANLVATKGKLPDTLESRMYRVFLEEMGEFERNKTVERLSGGTRRRLIDGLPHGGGGKTLYGYLPGERRISHGREAGCLTWVEDPEKAGQLRWLYDTVDATDIADISLRSLARWSYQAAAD